MKPPRVPPGCAPVTRYLWMDGGEIVYSLPAEMWWPLFPGTKVDDDGKRWIVIAVKYENETEPTHEMLQGGIIREIKKWNGRNYYNRSRRVLPRQARAS